jgi:hypothetical protein
MWPGLGHCIVRYVVMFALEEDSGPIFTGHQNMVAVCPE